MSLDLTLTPLYRIRGQEAPALPGLLALTPPRKTARGREQDRLVLYLLLNGNAPLSSAEYAKLAGDAGALFHQTPGPLTSAMRATAGALNQALMERNLSTSGRGQYAIGWLALLALREAQCTLLLSGPMHAFFLGQEARHIHEPALSGKGLGVGQTAPHYFTQTTLAANDRILLTGKVPAAWDSTLAAPGSASLEATRRRLLTLTAEDLHSVLMQVTPGAGGLSVLAHSAPPPAESAPVTPLPAAPTESLPLVEAAESTPEPEPYPAHTVEPSAYAIPAAPPPQATPRPLSASDFPASIPRARPRVEPAPVAEPSAIMQENPQPEAEPAGAETPPARLRRRRPSTPREPSEFARKSARAILGGVEGWRRGARKLDEGARKFLPRLLPGDEAGQSRPLPDATALFLALVIPLVIATVGIFAYFRYGVSQQYDTYMAQAYNARAQAASLPDPLMQSDAWNEVLLNVDKAEAYDKTPETRLLRDEANASLDRLQGILRLSFQTAIGNLPGNVEISRLAATEFDLYMLDAKTGEVLHASSSNNSRAFQLDTNFNCKPGQYGAYTVGPLVDILALPVVNMANANVLGVDANGNLLYCSNDDQVPQARPLPAPNTNWGKIKAFTMDSGNLYVLDAPSRAVWVYNGKDGEFTDLPYFFFGSQIPEIQDGIDLAARSDELYILHAGSRISKCSYSRLDVRPTTCQDLTLVNPFPTLRNVDLFSQANITQMVYNAALPDATLLLLGADIPAVLRLAPGSLELQNQFRPVAGNLRPGGIGAMTISPDHVLYLAVGDQVYFSKDMP